MNADDPRIRRELIHNQVVLLPTPTAWAEILKDGSLERIPLALPEWVAGWLREYARFDAAHLGLVQWRNRWSPLPLLCLDSYYYRVHFENVICEHCGKRCGPSATPDSVSYAGTGLTTAEVWAQFKNLPVRSCPHCSGMLRRRQTVWLVSEDAA